MIETDSIGAAPHPARQATSRIAPAAGDVGDGLHEQAVLLGQAAAGDDAVNLHAVLHEGVDDHARAELQDTIDLAVAKGDIILLVDFQTKDFTNTTAAGLSVKLGSMPVPAACTDPTMLATCGCTDTTDPIDPTTCGSPHP